LWTCLRVCVRSLSSPVAAREVHGAATDYQQVATRRYIDEQAVWALMRFADEPVERAPSRQVTRLQRGDASGFSPVDGGEFDNTLERLNDDDDGR
jgi:hypothetical protein